MILTLVLVCDKIYNMTEENSESRPHLEEPIHISDAVDAIMNELANPIEMRSAVYSLIDRQTELYQAHQDKRERGESLTAEDEKELEEISFALLTMQQVYEKYGRTDQ
jgi:hypothetical protein